MFLELIGRGEVSTPPASEAVISALPRIPVSQVIAEMNLVTADLQRRYHRRAINIASLIRRYLNSCGCFQEMVTEKEMCPVCLDKFRIEDPPAMAIKLQCRHTFCEGCLGPWLRRTATCPGRFLNSCHHFAPCPLSLCPHQLITPLPPYSTALMSDTSSTYLPGPYQFLLLLLLLILLLILLHSLPKKFAYGRSHVRGVQKTEEASSGKRDGH